MRLTDDHAALRESVRALVRTEINPHVDEWEGAGSFPAHDLFPRLAEIGLLGLEHPVENGGEGADHSFTMVACEELGRCHAAGIPMAINVQANMATPSLARHGSPELANASSPRPSPATAVAAIAVTEPDAGSDVAGLRTRAVRDGDDWVITGRKLYITNGVQADWALPSRPHLRRGRLPRDVADHRADRRPRVLGVAQARQARQPLARTPPSSCSTRCGSP